MHALIEQCVARLDKALEQLVRSGEELSIRKTMVNYTMDVIALCAFATKIDTHNTGTELHPFVKNSQVFFKPSPRFGIFFFLNATVPSLVKKFELSFVSKDVINYFKSTVSMKNGVKHDHDHLVISLVEANNFREKIEELVQKC